MPLTPQPENEKAHYDGIVRRIGQQLNSLREAPAPEGQGAVDARNKQIDGFTREYDHLKEKLDANDDMVNTGKSLYALSVKISTAQKEAAQPPASGEQPPALIASPPNAGGLPNAGLPTSRANAPAAVGRETRSPSPGAAPVPTRPVSND